MQTNRMYRNSAMLTIFILCIVFGSQVNANDCKLVKSKYEGRTFILQHNLRIDEDYQADWFNHKTIDFIDVGTEVIVTKVKSDRIELAIDAMDLTVTFNLEDATPSCSAILKKLLGSTPPSLEGLSTTDLKGIKAGKIMIGMTRRAVFLAIGYPPYSYQYPFREPIVNHDFTFDELVYLVNMKDFEIVKFQDETVVEIEKNEPVEVKFRNRW